MSKLLSDEELRTSYPLNTYSIGEQNELIELINTQKRLYAESVIGEYSQYPSHFNISDVLAEQRARITTKEYGL